MRLFLRQVCFTRTLHPSSSSFRHSSSRSIFSPVNETGTTKPFFVTTPIFYVNASPHIGHLHSIVLSDVLARYAKLRHPSRPVILTTGTDEHGLKIQQAAKGKVMGEKEFCDDVSMRFRDLARKANIDNDDFIRTTEPRHISAVQHFWSRLVASGDIYKSTHSGWYSISDETFFSASQVEKRDGKMVALETGNEVIWEEEENYKFCLSRYVPQLRKWLERPGVVYPENQRLNLLNQLDTLEDLSVSRPASRVRWGVPVPGDETQTIYVWVDALVNYLTVLGYPEKTHGWPVDVHVVGKDIVKFHALHWPALLISASLPPPNHVLAHAHWTMNHTKMSKSLGNVVDPFSALDHFTPDGLRWYLLRVGGSLSSDADFSLEGVEVQYKLLADQMGNLLSRMCSDKILGKVEEFIWERDNEMDKLLSDMKIRWEERMEVYGVSKACEGIMEVVASANRLFTSLSPWSTSPAKATRAIMYSYNSLRLSAILLQPIIPDKSSELLDRLGILMEERKWEDASWSEGIESGMNRPRMVLRRLKEGSLIWRDKKYLWPPLEGK
ncbi:hypothetical protein TREMEDRAFT_43432 [Tremella mesenterica DSM 1558]|uniref:uncharacterized protein n=1 Tax=Tremella mesenterica (strain ATCC 24925 / CBS 8224 / DSM 1558 / NBRC 9311 / NRRL Y-6157 / RJB 2259-6 / UBC 559-6) TaxID=578456 RepID=UPI0003F48F89|nr:uncharacterized protein TREMEDRAFT_43432 [Tremella mesenterica DSM 1558]EIW70887.1 hypothetical protein TREMEDRAFT_43432 [Tremella mesenterica DSM 1558]